MMGPPYPGDSIILSAFGGEFFAVTKNIIGTVDSVNCIHNNGLCGLDRIYCAAKLAC
jgi:hypothetical protein